MFKNKIMPYLKYTIILIIGVIIGNVINYKLIPNNAVEPLSAITGYVYKNSYSLGLLHTIKMGNMNKAITRIEETIIGDVIVIDELINESYVTDEEKALAYSQLNLLSVMNEKFNIPLWKKDKKLTSIFNKIQEMDPEKTKWFRCRDWSKPMWVGKDCNGKFY